ncbi:MAG TPA: metal-sulfur cluster assembly factor [Actinomycetota bacterium]
MDELADTKDGSLREPEADGAGDDDPRMKPIRDALMDVIDPELGINIIDLGLVYDITIEGDSVHVTYTLTTMGCPIGPLIESQMRQALDKLDGIDRFEAEMVFSPPWSPEMMSEEAKAALGVF